MSNEIQLFQNQNFGEIRVIEKDGEPWFVVVDVCRALDIQNPTQAIGRLDDDERAMFNIGRQGETNCVNEPGLYTLVLGSRKPEAKAFKRWITHDVIPSIRKTGSYAVTPKDYASALRALADEWEKNQKLLEENELQKQVIEDYEPKVTYYDTILQSNDAFTVTQIAADYGISAKELNRILYQEGIQHRVGKQWVLYRKYMGNGFTKSATHKFVRSDGSIGTSILTKWTQKGRVEIHYILERRGIKALMDLEECNHC